MEYAKSRKLEIYSGIIEIYHFLSSDKKIEIIASLQHQDIFDDLYEDPWLNSFSYFLSQGKLIIPYDLYN